MRHAPFIAIDGHFLLQPRQRLCALYLRQWPVHIPPGQRPARKEKHYDNPQENAKKEAQGVSRRTCTEFQSRRAPALTQPATRNASRRPQRFRGPVFQRAGYMRESKHAVAARRLLQYVEGVFLPYVCDAHSIGSGVTCTITS